MTRFNASARAGLTLAAVLLSVGVAQADVAPSIAGNLAVHYDFEHADPNNTAIEVDQGSSHTDGWLVNGGAAMRVRDGAWRGSRHSLQTKQRPGPNSDWKFGVYNQPGVATLGGFNTTTGITVMGFVKPTGTNPNLNTNTPDPTDFYNAIGLIGVLSGGSNGHDVRALLEIINVSGTLRLVALGRRIDGASSRTFAATAPWPELLPANQWTHLAATFNFADGTMALYRNGVQLEGFYTAEGNSWGTGATSATSPSGLKVGGSYPANTNEQNPFNGRFDELMFLNRTLSAEEVAAQYALFDDECAGHERHGHKHSHGHEGRDGG